MNALMHRNYETSNAPIRFFWFDDRIEISNPGGPFGRVTEENFTKINDYRNPGLASGMKALRYVNRFGRGIDRIYQALASNGNPEPEFLIDLSTWAVTVRGAQ
jgi:ATP-dependent DNA helicase RecG